ncbi:MAG TPA: hypothetical protein DEP28_07815 [Bacteroidetes bacterium]|nr:hypothetical protein [Ignavibacteria bacterium]HCA43143.1 hypothetical protein [Bacteroidota bacterium]HCN36311.1 hypothetical protein [Bacteroidota bacterium]
MSDKKKENKTNKPKSSKKEISKKRKDDDDEKTVSKGNVEHFDLIDDEYEEDTFVEEIDEDEAEEEFKHFVEEHDKELKGAKVIKVFDKIGKPKLKKLTDLDKESLKDEYKKLICLLDEKNIVIHFQNDYPLTEMYRFVTEEIMNQSVEDVKKPHSHINFIYEDFHPEVAEDEDEEENF